MMNPVTEEHLLTDRILVGVDGSEVSQLALDHAIVLARVLKAVLQPLYVLSIAAIHYEGIACDPSLAGDALEAEGREFLARAEEKLRFNNIPGLSRIVKTVGFEDVSQVIVRSAVELQAGLIVLGTHGRRGFRRLMLGSVAEHTLRLSRIPLLLVPPVRPVPDLARSSTSTQHAHSRTARTG